jgi:tellurite resistance protein TerC
MFGGQTPALTFLTGYVIEESLSMDNIFVIVLIFDYFAVPKQYQHRVLFYGILGALVMRGIFIALGTALLARFHWIIYLFGAMLVVTGVRMAFKQDESFDADQNPIVKAVRRFVPLSQSFHGKHFFTVENGRRIATPLLLVLVLVEFTDLIFAIDSIPAIFGVTRDPFIVFTSNIFAVLGLRSLYFLLASVVEKFHLLKYGLAIILTFVGAKMLLERWIHIDILLSLGVIVVVLALSILASLKWPAAGEKTERTGSIFGGHHR